MPQWSSSCGLCRLSPDASTSSPQGKLARGRLSYNPKSTGLRATRQRVGLALQIVDYSSLLLRLLPMESKIRRFGAGA